MFIISCLDDRNSLLTNPLAPNLSQLPVYQLPYCSASCYFLIENPSVSAHPSERIQSSYAARGVLVHSLSCCFPDVTSFLPLVPFPLTSPPMRTEYTPPLTSHFLCLGDFIGLEWPPSLWPPRKLLLTLQDSDSLLWCLPSEPGWRTLGSPCTLAPEYYCVVWCVSILLLLDSENFKIEGL